MTLVRMLNCNTDHIIDIHPMEACIAGAYSYHRDTSVAFRIETVATIGTTARSTGAKTISPGKVVLELGDRLGRGIDPGGTGLRAGMCPGIYQTVSRGSFP